jgi:hypothetical protein
MITPANASAAISHRRSTPLEPAAATEVDDMSIYRSPNRRNAANTASAAAASRSWARKSS